MTDITPAWVDGVPGDFVGYYRYEEDQAPTLIFIPTLLTTEADRAERGEDPS